jgi:hypothetical protein
MKAVWTASAGVIVLISAGLIIGAEVNGKTPSPRPSAPSAPAAHTDDLTPAAQAVIAASDSPPGDEAQIQPVDQPLDPVYVSFDKFKATTRGKTKNQVESQFGAPDSVTNSGETWVYKGLSVVDTDTGKPIGAIFIDFDDAANVNGVLTETAGHEFF